MTLETKLAGVPFAANLARFGDRIAVSTGSESLSYRELGRRVEEMAASFGYGRRLVALEADNTLPALVAYLAALSSGSDGGSRVEVLRNGQVELVPVTVGLSADGFAQVTPKGDAKLSEGDQVVVGR